ncbi:MAG: hypothetical protein GEU99_19875 [Luteitalea sp.]|nr:hypothetical protein [Luteitalea sp.]
MDSEKPTLATEIVRGHDAGVEELLERQVTDPESPWRGASPDEFGLYWPHSAAGVLDAFTAALLTPASKFYKSNVLAERMRLAAGFLGREQSEQGYVTLPTANVNSPPDTGFVVRNVATATLLARRHGERDLEKLTASFLRRAGKGLAVGGVHTPNHRWVVSAALAQIHELYPDPALVGRIDQWLAEGIDITKDGFYSERSTLGYGPTCNNALIAVASKLERPELLQPVRDNLDATIYLIHPGDEVVTEISRRQDADSRAGRGLSRYWFASRYLAAHDGNGRYAALADLGTGTPSLSDVMEYPELLQEGPARVPLPDTYERQFESVGLTRVRRGETSANVLLGNSRFFSVRRGEAVINAVRLATAFFGKGQFVPDTMEKTRDGYHLRQRAVEGPYYQPFEPPRRIGASVEAWYGAREERPKSEVSYLEQSAIVTELPSGFRLQLRSTGPTKMPVSVEINFREGGTLDGVRASSRAADTWLLAEGGGTYQLGNTRIRLGPGAHPHEYTQVRDTEPKLSGPSVYVTGYTPFVHTIEFHWS